MGTRLVSFPKPKCGRARRDVKSDAGFTLVEALVSLFVFSLISAGCVLMLVQTVQSQARMRTVDAELRQIQITQATLTADLAQMTIRPAGAATVRFVGGAEDTALAFLRVAAAPAEPTPAKVAGVATRLVLVSYAIEANRLIRRASPATDAPGEAQPITQILLSDAKNIAFEFYDGRRWLGAWPPEASGLPRAVALTFARTGTGTVKARIAALVGVGP